MSRSLSVRALDLYLNRQILLSERPAQQNAWWHVKIRAKRLLGYASERDVPRLARRILRAIQPPRRPARPLRRVA